LQVDFDHAPGTILWTQVNSEPLGSGRLEFNPSGAEAPFLWWV
jgi:hypothetical protein